MPGPYEFKYKVIDGPVPDGVEVIDLDDVIAEMDRITEDNWSSVEFNHDVIEWLMKQHIPGYEPQPYVRLLRSL